MKDYRIFLRHIFESIEEIEKDIQGIDEVKFSQSTQIQDAVIRRLEIIGEAAKHIPEEIRNKYHLIPWKKVAGSRDVLIHKYFEIDLEAVWDTVVKDLPRLKQEIRPALAE